MRMASAAAFAAVLFLVSPAPAQPVLEVQPSYADHTLRLRLWKNEGAAQELAVTAGRQSRDLGARLREAARDGLLAPQPGRHAFTLRFINLAFELAQNGRVRMNGEVFVLPPNFGGTDARGQTLDQITVEVTGGEGRLEISERWIREDTVLQIIPPPGLCAYPPPGRRLQTAPGELARRTREDDVTNFHFVAK